MWNAALRPLFTMVLCLCRVMVVCERAGSCSPLGVQVAFVFVIVCVDETQIPIPRRRLRLRLSIWPVFHVDSTATRAVRSVEAVITFRAIV